ncbi:MAG: hypothetical protein JWQ71_2028, partial [Pedosphaera sp.]|nr:hypothetical protein [Pedosphaera sp.]
AFGATVLSSSGAADIFLTKYDSAGNVVWAKKAGGTADDFGNAIAMDVSGNVYITGYFLSTNANFSGTILTNLGSADIFVAKYNSAGTLLWAKLAGGNGYDAGNGIAVDSAGNSYVTGFFYSTSANFGNITLTNNGQNNIFVAKYDSAGNVLWAKQAGGTSFDMGFAIAADAAGNSYITGNFFSPTAAFGGGITLTNTGENDVFVAKYDPSGNPLWARQVKGASDDFGYGIVVDAAGNSYVNGTFQSAIATFATGITLTNGGYNDIFIAKYNSVGTALWAKKAGGSSDEYAYAMAIDANTNLYLTGNFYSTNANFGGITLTNTGGHEIFLARYTSAGNVVWVKQAGGSSFETGNGVGVDVGGNSYLTGYFSPTNVNFSGILITNAGAKDIFAAKLDGDPPTLNSTRSGNKLILNWPTNQLDFILEGTSVLSSFSDSAWFSVTNRPVIVGSQNVVTNNLPGNVFFRLRK